MLAAGNLRVSPIHLSLQGPCAVAAISGRRAVTVPHSHPEMATSPLVERFLAMTAEKRCSILMPGVWGCPPIPLISPHEWGPGG
jgi:hypothetical protein